jgi:hypothetical protein
VERASVDEAYLDLTQAVEHRISTKKQTVSISELPTTFIVGFDSSIDGKGMCLFKNSLIIFIFFMLLYCTHFYLDDTFN